MPKIEFSTGERIGLPSEIIVERPERQGLYLSRTAYDEFDERVLGLGDIGKEGTYVQSLAAIFDLAGFTTFCKQPESHLVVPDFLKRFLSWLFLSIKKETINEKAKAPYKDVFSLFCPLPFFAKFTGDGVCSCGIQADSAKRTSPTK